MNSGAVNVHLQLPAFPATAIVTQMPPAHGQHWRSTYGGHGSYNRGYPGGYNSYRTRKQIGPGDTPGFGGGPYCRYGQVSGPKLKMGSLEDTLARFSIAWFQGRPLQHDAHALVTGAPLMSPHNPTPGHLCGALWPGILQPLRRFLSFHLPLHQPAGIPWPWKAQADAVPLLVPVQQLP